MKFGECSGRSLWCAALGSEYVEPTGEFNDGTELRMEAIGTEDVILAVLKCDDLYRGLHSEQHQSDGTGRCLVCGWCSKK